MVRKSGSDSIGEAKEGSGDVDVEGDMIIGDLDQEGREQVDITKSRPSQGNLRDDFDKIIEGKLSMCLLPSPPTPHPACQILFILSAIANPGSLPSMQKHSHFRTTKSLKSFCVNDRYGRVGATNLLTA
jgi:hypothetical protein